MNCTSCGIYNEEGAQFCANCGAKLDTAATPAPQPEFNTTEPPAGFTADQNAENTYGNTTQPEIPTPPVYMPPTYNAVIGTIKQIGSSGKYKALAILYSVIIGISVIIEFMSGFIIPTLYSTITTYADDISVDFTGVFSSFPSLTMPILIIVGLWLVYTACKKPENTVKTGGFTILKVVSILQLVGVCMATVCLGIILLAFNVIPELKVFVNEMNSEIDKIGASVDLSQVLTVVGAISIGALALVILYNVKKLQTINAVTDSLKTGIPSQKASSFYGVMQYISGVILIIYGLVVIVGGFAVSMLFHDVIEPMYMELIMIALAAVMFATAAFNFILGNLVFEFRSEMQNIKNASDTAFIQD